MKLMTDLTDLTRLTRRLLGLALVTVLVLPLAACGADEASADDKADAADKTKAPSVSDANRKSEPAPPADYVRSRCTECSCRVYMGDGGYCSRPACKHHWKDHKRPPQG